MEVQANKAVKNRAVHETERIKDHRAILSLTEQVAQARSPVRTTHRVYEGVNQRIHKTVNRRKVRRKNSSFKSILMPPLREYLPYATGLRRAHTMRRHFFSSF